MGMACTQVGIIVIASSSNLVTATVVVAYAVTACTGVAYVVMAEVFMAYVAVPYRDIATDLWARQLWPTVSPVELWLM